MHHSLRLYGQHQRQFLMLYMFLAKLISVPLLGRWVRSAANIYGRRGHGGYLLTLAEAEKIVDASRDVALGPCNCRQLFRHCDSPIMSEILIGDGVEAFSTRQEADGFRRVSKEEAKDILRDCHQKRLTHTIMQCGQHFYAICNCCSCCCVPMRLRHEYGVGYALVRNQTVVADYQRQQL